VPRNNQVARQWTLIRLLSGRVGRTLAQLQAELGVGKRTVQRDIAVLEEVGFPITSEERDGTGFWHLMDGFHIEAPVSLTLTEQMALYFSRGLLQPLQGTPVYDALQSALQKIGATLPPQSFQFLRGLDNAISVQGLGSKDYSRSKEAIKVLTHSVFHKFTTLIKHKTVRFERGIEREVDPYRFWYVNNGMYLVAHDHRSHELRLFAVERITAAKATNRRFEIPAEFNFEEFTKSAFSLIWGKPQDVKIRFSKEQAPYIRERTWHPTQMVKESDDGSIDFTMNVADLWEVKRWLIGFGSDAEVLEPEQLRKDIELECVRVVRRSKEGRVDS